MTPPAVALCLTRLRFVLARIDPVDLALLNEKTAPYSTDQLLELGVDLGDTVGLYEAGVVNATVVREAALAVAVEALKVYLATTGEGQQDGR